MARDKNSFIAAERLNEDEKLLIAHISDMLKICEKTFSPRFTGFLSESKAALAMRFLEYCYAQSYMLFGGYSGAQRVMLGVFPEYDEPSESDFPIAIVRISGRMTGNLTHRDYLGSLMSLGIERDQTGDIVCDDGGAYAMLSPAAADMAVMQITKIGRAGVICSFETDSSKVVREDKFSEISTTVSSLRLDCIVSAAVRLSREKAAMLIRSGAVSVNHGTAESVSENLSQGDIISVRGHGRFILDHVGDRTKKDRLHIAVKKYL